MTDRLAAKIKAILLHDWDPIGVRDVPQAQDEYDGYVSRIASSMTATGAKQAIVAQLLEIERDRMGLGGDDYRAQRVADLLLRAQAGMR